MFKQSTIETRWGAITGWETPFGLVALINPKWLDVDNGDSGYQRPYYRAWAEQIASHWDNAKFRPISGRVRQGYIYVTNGQHTANAAAMAGVPEVLVIINNGAESRQTEAKEFVAMQVAVKRMRPYDTYRASLVAGDVDALILRKVAAERNIQIGPQRAPGVLSAIRAARDVAREGEEKLAAVLDVALLWDENDLDRFKYEVLLGISKALDANGPDVVAKNARRTTARALYAKANAEAAGKGYVTISNIAALLGKRPRGNPPSVLRET